MWLWLSAIGPRSDVARLSLSSVKNEVPLLDWNLLCAETRSKYAITYLCMLFAGLDIRAVNVRETHEMAILDGGVVCSMTQVSCIEEDKSMVVVRNVDVYGLARSQMKTVVVVEGCRRICFTREFWRREKA